MPLNLRYDVMIPIEIHIDNKNNITKAYAEIL